MWSPPPYLEQSSFMRTHHAQAMVSVLTAAPAFISPLLRLLLPPPVRCLHCNCVYLNIVFVEYMYYYRLPCTTTSCFSCCCCWVILLKLVLCWFIISGFPIIIPGILCWFNRCWEFRTELFTSWFWEGEFNDWWQICWLLCCICKLGIAIGHTCKEKCICNKPLLSPKQSKKNYERYLPAIH